MPAIELIRPLRLSPTGGSELTILNRGSNSVYYGRTPTVSVNEKVGTIGVGESLTLTKGFVWVVAEATPAIVDLKEVELASAAGGGISQSEADLRYLQIVELVSAKTITEDTILPPVKTATVNVLTISAAAPKLTLPATTVGSSITVYIKQDAEGSRAPTFAAPSGAIRWPEGTLPTFSAAAGAVDVLNFIVAQTGFWDGYIAGYALA